MKDAVQRQDIDAITDADPIPGKVGKLEQVESMRRRLETLVEISFMNERVFNAANHVQQNNYLRVFGLLKTIRGLHEKYTLEITSNPEGPDDDRRRMIS